MRVPSSETQTARSPEAAMHSMGVASWMTRVFLLLRAMTSSAFPSASTACDRVTARSDCQGLDSGSGSAAVWLVSKSQTYAGPSSARTMQAFPWSGTTLQSRAFTRRVASSLPAARSSRNTAPPTDTAAP